MKRLRKVRTAAVSTQKYAPFSHLMSENNCVLPSIDLRGDAGGSGGAPKGAKLFVGEFSTPYPP